MKTNCTRNFLLIVSLLLAGGIAAQAQTTYIKQANTTAINVAGSWSAGGPPGSGDIGKWDSTATATGDTITSIGGAYAMGEILIGNNTAGAVSVTDTTTADILTLNGATGTGVGLDMSLANNSLTIGSPFKIGASQTWNIASGKTVTLSGTNWLQLNGVLTVEGGGAVDYYYSTPPTTAGTGNSSAGIVVSNSTFSVYVHSVTASAQVNFLGATTTLTLTGNSTFNSAEAGTTGDHKQTFTSLTLNPGTDFFTQSPGRGSSSGMSVGFTAVSRNAGSMADFSANADANGFGTAQNCYALPGSTVVLGYATYGANDWYLAKGAGTIPAAATYVNDTWATANNTTVTTSSSPTSGSTVNSLRFNTNGTWTVTLTGANTITTGGILLGANIGASTETITGGTLTSGNTTADSLHDLVIINNTASSGNLVINSVIADNGASSVGLTVGTTSATTPSGSVQLGGANTFSGTTYVSKGTLKLLNSLALQNSTFNTTLPGTLSFGSLTSATFGGISGMGNLALPTSFALTIGNNNVNSTYNGALSGTGATVNKTGSGTFTLNGANTYTGTTTVSAGTLALGTNGSLTGPASITSSATLDVSAANPYKLASAVSGTGTIKGALSVNGGGQLSPVGTVGVLTLSSNLTLNGGTIAVSVDASVPANGTVIIGSGGSGNLNLNSGTVQLTITGGTLANGTYKVIGVPNGTITGSGSSIAVSGFSQTGQAASLVANSSGGGGFELDLVVVTYVSQNLLWLGDGSGAGLWNAGGDADWNDLGPTPLNPSVFNNSDNVTFDDTSANTSVNLSGTLSPLTVTINGTQSYTLASTGKISGSASLTNNSSGTLTVLTTNDYTGGTTIGASSTLQVGNGTASGAIGSGPVVDNNALNFNLPAASSQSMGAASGTGALTKTGAGTLVLNGADTLAGATTITAGTVKQGSANVLPNGAGVGNTVVNGTLDMGGQSGTVNGLSGSGTIDSTAAGSPTLSVTGSGSFGGTIKNTSGSLALNMNGSGNTLTLGGANTYSGGTTVSAGTLQLGNSGAISSGTLLSVVASASLDLNGFSPTVDALTGGGTIDSSASGTMTLTLGNSGGSGTFSGLIKNTSGTVSLVKNGSGTEILSGASTYTGSTTVNLGVLQLNSGGAINGGAATDYSQLTLNGGSIAGTTFSLGASATLLVSSGSASFSGAFSNPTGTSAYTVAANGGSLSLGSLSVLRSGSTFTAQPTQGDTSGNIYINGATVNVTNAFTMTTDASSANMRIDSGSVTVGGVLSIECSNTRWSVVDVNGGTLTDNDTSGVGISIGGTVSGPSELLVRGTGTATTPKITFGQTGSTTTCVLNMLGTGSLYVGSGGMVQGGTATPTITLGGTAILGATANWSSALNMTLSGATIQAADASSVAHNITLSGILGGTGALTKTGGGTLTLSSAGNTYSGLTTINAGTLNINSEYALGGANYSGLTFGGGTLQYAATLLNGTTDVSTKPVTFNGNATIDVNGNSINFANPIGNSGTGGLTVISSVANGILALAGADTYTGNTTVNSGTLLANNTSGSATGSGGVTVAAGAILGGTGTIGGATTLQSGAMLAAGHGGGIGTLTFNNNLTLNATSTNAFVVTPTGGASNGVVVAGALTINSSVISIKSGTALHHSTNTLFNYTGGSDSGTFNPSVVFDVAPPGGAAIVDTGSLIQLVVSNIPPVAGASFTNYVTLGQPSTVQIVGGKYAPTDGDGDALSITITGAPANGSAGTDGTNITYTASSGTTDSLTYTVSDGFGGSATQTIYYVINTPAAQAPNVVNQGMSGGNETMEFLGIPGFKYALDETHYLTPPVTWTPVVTNTAASDGTLHFTNTVSGIGDGDYYRTRYVP